MPIYCYRCVNNHLTDDYVPVAEPRATVSCDVCGQPAHRSYPDEHKHTDLVDRERWSDSMGVNPRQIPEAVRTFPGSVYDSEGRLLIKNRKHKLFEAKRRGLTELD